MEKLSKQGLIRKLGLSNFNQQQIMDVMGCAQIKPKVLQIEVHCYFQQKSLRNFCQDHSIVVEAFAPLGSPKTAVNLGKKVLLDDPTIGQLAKKYERSPAQIALRWLQQRDVIPIVSAETVQRIGENVQIGDFSISEDDLKTIDALDCGERIFYFDSVPG